MRKHNNTRFIEFPCYTKRIFSGAVDQSKESIKWEKTSRTEKNVGESRSWETNTGVKLYGIGLVSDAEKDLVHIQLDAILVVTVIVIHLHDVVPVEAQLLRLLAEISDTTPDRAVGNGGIVVDLLLILLEHRIQLADDLHNGVESLLDKHAAERPRLVLVREHVGRGERDLKGAGFHGGSNALHKGTDLEIAEKEEFCEAHVVLVESLLFVDQRPEVPLLTPAPSIHRLDDLLHLLSSLLRRHYASYSLPETTKNVGKRRPVSFDMGQLPHSLRLLTLLGLSSPL